MIALRPSNAARLEQCPGNAALAELVKPWPQDTSAADEGTRAHELAPIIYSGGDVGDADPVMVGHVRAYCDHLHSICDPLGLRAHFEAEVSAPEIHPLAKGTCDFNAYDTRTGTLYTRDLKYGWALVEDILQLIIYSDGLIRPDTQWIDLGYFQPRPYHQRGPARCYRIPIAGWAEYRDRARAVYSAATQQGAPLRTGNYCADCKQAHECPALRRAVLNVIDRSNNMYPDKLSGELIADELVITRHAARLVSARLDAIEADMMARINAGQNVPGWSITTGRANRQWAPECDVVGVGDMLGIPLTDTKAVTPAEAERRGAPRELIDSMTITPAGKPKLTPFDSTLAKKVFNDGN